MGVVHDRWDPAADAALRAAVVSGASAAEAAASVRAVTGRATSRNMAIGRAHRLGLRFGSHSPSKGGRSLTRAAVAALGERGPRSATAATAVRGSSEMRAPVLTFGSAARRHAEDAAAKGRDARKIGVADPHPAGSAGCPSPAKARRQTGVLPDALWRARGEGFATVGVTLMALERHHCRWPVGLDRAPGEGHELFCAEAKEGRGPYCAHHRRAAS